MAIEITRGATVMADPQPVIDPVVTPNIKSMTATDHVLSKE
jgi:hypothetical protein